MSGLDIFSAVVAVGQVADYLRKILRAVEQIKSSNTAAQALIEKGQLYHDILQAVRAISENLAERSKNYPNLRDEVEKTSCQILIRSIFKFKEHMERFTTYLQLVERRQDATSFSEQTRLHRLLNNRKGLELIKIIEENIENMRIGIDLYKLSPSVLHSQRNINATGSSDTAVHFHNFQLFPLPASLADAFGKYLNSDIALTEPTTRRQPSVVDVTSEEEEEQLLASMKRQLDEEMEENLSDLKSLRQYTRTSHNEGLDFDERTPLTVLPRLIKRHEAHARVCEAEGRLEEAEGYIVEALRLCADLLGYGKSVPEVNDLWESLECVLGDQGKEPEQRNAIFHKNELVSSSRPRLISLIDPQLEPSLPRGPATPEASRQMLRLAGSHYRSHMRREKTSTPADDLIIAEKLCNYAFKGFVDIGVEHAPFLETVALLIKVFQANDKPLYADVYKELYPRAIRGRSSTLNTVTVPTSPAADAASSPSPPIQAIPSPTRSPQPDLNLLLQPSNTTRPDNFSARALSVVDTSSDDGTGANINPKYLSYINAHLNDEDWPDLSTDLRKRSLAHWNYTLVEAVTRGLKDIVDSILEPDPIGPLIDIRPDVCNVQGRPLLHIATINEDNDMVCKLLRHHANVLKSDRAGFTALHCAAARGLDDIARSLLQSYRPGDIDTVDNAKNTALHEAVRRRQIDMVRTLLNANPLEEVRNGSGRTALEEAIQNDDLDIAILWKGRASVTSVDWKRFPDKRSIYLPKLTSTSPSSPKALKKDGFWKRRK